MHSPILINPPSTYHWVHVATDMDLVDRGQLYTALRLQSYRHPGTASVLQTPGHCFTPTLRYPGTASAQQSSVHCFNPIDTRRLCLSSTDTRTRSYRHLYTLSQSYRRLYTLSQSYRHPYIQSHRHPYTASVLQTPVHSASVPQTIAVLR